MSIKLIAIDLDGTLFNNRKEITPGVHHALRAAKAKGVKVVICTGRPLIGAVQVLKDLNLEDEGDYCITYNGALVQSSHDGHPVIHQTLDFSDYTTLEALSREIGVHFHALDMNTLYTANKNISEYTVRESYLTGMPLQFAHPDEMDPNLIFGKVMMIDDPAVLDAGIAKMPTHIFEKYTILKSEPFYLELLNKKASKGLAVKGLAELLGFTKDEVMAIGDNENDLDMIEYAGLGVAMGNAVPSVLAAGDFITRTNDEDGVAHAVEKFVLNV